MDKRVQRTRWARISGNDLLTAEQLEISRLQEENLRLKMER